MIDDSCCCCVVVVAATVQTVAQFSAASEQAVGANLSFLEALTRPSL